MASHWLTSTQDWRILNSDSTQFQLHFKMQCPLTSAFSGERIYAHLPFALANKSWSDTWLGTPRIWKLWKKCRDLPYRWRPMSVINRLWAMWNFLGGKYWKWKKPKIRIFRPTYRRTKCLIEMKERVIDAMYRQILCCFAFIIDRILHIF